MFVRSADARRRRRGNIALLTALMITMLMAFVALSFDVGNLFRVRTETQSGLDAAALAGASALAGLGDAEVRRRAVGYGNRHFANTGALGLDDSSIEIGVWDRTARQFAASAATITPEIIPAVRVRFQQPVATPFARVGGTAQMTVGGSAIAVLGGPSRTACGFPLVLPDCMLATVTQTSCDVCLRMSDDGSDNAAWTAFGFSPGNGNPGPGIAAAVSSACFTANGAVAVGADGRCAGQCGTASQVEDSLGLNNGNLMNTGANGFCLLIEQLLLRNGASNPSPVTVEVPVVNNPQGCSSPLSGSHNVVGFIELDILGVGCSNNSTPILTPMASRPSCAASGTSSGSGGSGSDQGKGKGSGGSGGGTTTPSGKFLIVALHRDPTTGTCDRNTRPSTGGGAYYGTYGRPVLVE